MYFPVGVQEFKNCVKIHYFGQDIIKFVCIHIIDFQICLVVDIWNLKS